MIVVPPPNPPLSTITSYFRPNTKIYGEITSSFLLDYSCPTKRISLDNNFLSGSKNLIIIVIRPFLLYSTKVTPPLLLMKTYSFSPENRIYYYFLHQNQTSQILIQNKRYKTIYVIKLISNNYLIINNIF